MVGPGNSYGRNNYNRGGSYSGQQHTQSAPQPAPLIEKKKLPENYVDSAENVMRGLQYPDRNGKMVFGITTSQIRKILSLITDILNAENLSRDEKLSDESYQMLQMARVRIAYDSGRDNTGKVKEFVEKSGLLSYIKGVEKDRAEFIRFARYVEALVAWHRYLGGKD